MSTVTPPFTVEELGAEMLRVMADNRSSGLSHVTVENPDEVDIWTMKRLTSRPLAYIGKPWMVRVKNHPHRREDEPAFQLIQEDGEWHPGDPRPRNTFIAVRYVDPSSKRERKAKARLTHRAIRGYLGLG